MIMQYDDMVLQVRDRLRAVIPQTPEKIASVQAIENSSLDLENFLKSNEISKVFVSYSGNSTEGGRNLEDFSNLSLSHNSQRLTHTFEVHVCTKRMMNEDLTKPGNTMLRLMWTIRAGLVGLKFYRRNGSGVVDRSLGEQTFGLFLIETFFHENYPGVVAVCRFQCYEPVVEADDVNPEIVWGVYKEFTFEEYSQQDGETPNISGTPNTVVVEPET